MGSFDDSDVIIAGGARGPASGSDGWGDHGRRSNVVSKPRRHVSDAGDP